MRTLYIRNEHIYIYEFVSLAVNVRWFFCTLYARNDTNSCSPNGKRKILPHTNRICVILWMYSRDCIIFFIIWWTGTVFFFSCLFGEEKLKRWRAYTRDRHQNLYVVIRGVTTYLYIFRACIWVSITSFIGIRTHRWFLLQYFVHWICFELLKRARIGDFMYLGIIYRYFWWLWHTDVYSCCYSSYFRRNTMSITRNRSF